MDPFHFDLTNNIAISSDIKVYIHLVFSFVKNQVLKNYYTHLLYSSPISHLPREMELYSH